jgi:hypothetical protein
MKWVRIGAYAWLGDAGLTIDRRENMNLPARCSRGRGEKMSKQLPDRRFLVTLGPLRIRETTMKAARSAAEWMLTQRRTA